MRRINEHQSRDILRIEAGKVHDVGAPEGMAHHDIGSPFAGREQQGVKVAGLVVGFEIPGSRLAPHHARTAVGAGTRGGRDRIMHSAPTERSHGIEPRLEHDGGRPAAAAVDLHVAAADIDEAPLHGKLAGGPPAHDLLVADPHEYRRDDEAADYEGDSFDPSHHVFILVEGSEPRRHANAWRSISQISIG